LALAVYLDSLLGHTMATPAPGTGNAGRLSWTTAPHIAHAVAAHSFSAKVQVLHHQWLQEEEAMVRAVCAVFQHLVFFSHSLTQVRQNLPKQRHIGISRKLLTRQTHLACLIKAVV
jgi:hypothetical protein